MPERVAQFHAVFLDDLIYWVRVDRRMALRLLALVVEALRDLYEASGKPERLRYSGGNVWSRRIGPEHRLVYEVNDTAINFLRARGHYYQ